MKFLFSILLTISGLVVKGEQIIRCNSDLMNLCGSDMVIYKSECDFLASKDKNSDLTILDLADCISFGNITFNNSSNLNISKGASDLDSRSLRGSVMLNKGSEISSYDVNESKKNETKNELVKLVDREGDNSDKNSTLVHFSSDEIIQNVGLVTAGDRGGSDIENAFYMVNRNSNFKEVNKYNVNMINVIVENFDISSFVLSDGKYNFSRLSLFVLKTIIEILRNQKSKMENYLNQLDSTKINKNDKFTSANSGFSNLKEIQDFDLNKIMNSSHIGQRMYNELNVTFRLANSNNTNSYFNSSDIVDSALQTLNSIGIGNLKDDTYISSLNNNLTIIRDEREDLNRLLLTSEKESTSLEKFNSYNATNKYFSKFDECELNVPSDRKFPAASNFHCIFPNNSTDNLKIASKYILGLTELALKNTFENNFGNNSTNSLEVNARTLISDRSMENKEQAADIVLDFFDLILSPINITNNDLKDLVISDIFVNFNLDLLKNEPANPKASDVNETAIFEAIDEIFKSDLILDIFSLDEQKPNKTTNTKLLNPLRIISEIPAKIDKNSTIDELFREFPPAFDRVRGQGCIVECGDQVDYHCANNGVTYKNLCELRNAQCNNKNLIFVSFGKCLPLVIRS